MITWPNKYTADGFREIARERKEKTEASDIVGMSHWQAFPRAQRVDAVQAFPTVLLLPLAIELLASGAVAALAVGQVLPFIPAVVVSFTTAGLAYINARLLIRWRDRALR